MPSAADVAPGELEQAAGPAILLPVVGEGFGRGDVAGNGKNEGVRAMITGGPITIEFREDMTERGALAVMGQVADADVVGDGVHWDTS